MTTEEYRKILEAQENETKQKRNQKEGKLQTLCVKSFRAGYPLLAEYMTHLKNEEPDAKRRMIGAAMGVVAGYPDLMLFVPAEYTEATMVDGMPAKWTTRFNGLALEIKNGKKGTQGMEQKICQMRMEACGYKYQVIRTIDEFEAAVKEYVKHIQDDTIQLINIANVEADKIRNAERLKKDQAATARARKELAQMLKKA